MLLFVAVYLLPLGWRQLSVPDEMRYGEIAREMLASGDFVVPHADGVRYFEKPAGGYWPFALSLRLFGKSNAALRLPAALATGLAACALYLFARRTHGPKTAGLSAFVLLSCVLTMGVGTFGALDAPLTGLVTPALVAFFLATTVSGMRRTAWLALAGAATGAAFLVKGFVAPAIVAATTLPYLIWQRDAKALLTLPWIPLAVALAVVAPWATAIAAREPDFWRFFVCNEHLRRFFDPRHAQHAAPFWYYLPVALVATLPWTPAAPGLFRSLLKARGRDPAVRFAVCWAVVPLLFFSLSHGKLAPYVLPCIPPFAFLTALALTDRIEANPNSAPLRKTTLFLLLALLAALIGLFVVGGLRAFGLLPRLDARFLPKFAAVSGAFLLAFAVLLVARRGRCDRTGLVGPGWAAGLIFIGVQAGLPTEISTPLGLQAFLEAHCGGFPPNALLVADSRTALALAFVCERDDVYVLERPGELRYGLSYPDAKNRFLDFRRARALLRDRGARPVIFVLRAAPGSCSRAALPRPDRQARWHKIWIAEYAPLPPPPDGERSMLQKTKAGRHAQ